MRAILIFITRPMNKPCYVSIDVIVFQHPFTIYSCPALLKEWLDRVLSRGFASDRKPTGGKVLAQRDYDRRAGERYRYDALKPLSNERCTAPLELTAAMCRMHWMPPIIVYRARRQSPQTCWPVRKPGGESGLANFCERGGY